MSETGADPRGPLDPQVRQLFELLAPGRAARVLEAGALREAFAALAPALTAGAPEVASEREIRIPGPEDELRALVFHPTRPAAEPPPLLLFAHGGGFVIMSPETHAGLTKKLCEGAGAVVVSLDYRLAPEHPYPAGLDDCVAALRWLRAGGAAELGADPARIGMAGDSAGGNLTAATVLRALADGEPVPRAALLLCPFTDGTFRSESFRRLAPDDPVLDAEMLYFFRDAYRPSGGWTEPFVSPHFAERLEGFPRTQVVAGAIDPLRDDAVAFAEHLRKAGAPVELREHAGMPHDFMLFPGIEAGRRCVEETCAFLRSAL